MRGPTDGTLLGQAIDGDRTGFLRLVDRYGPLVTAVAQHHLGASSPAVQQVVAETFRESFLDLRRLPDPESFYRHLLAIAREKAIAHREHAPSQPKGEETAREESLMLAQVVRWKYLEGLGYEEIARRLGIPANAVDPLIQKGRIQSRWSHWTAEEIS